MDNNMQLIKIDNHQVLIDKEKNNVIIKVYNNQYNYKSDDYIGIAMQFVNFSLNQSRNIVWGIYKIYCYLPCIVNNRKQKYR